MRDFEKEPTRYTNHLTFTSVVSEEREILGKNVSMNYIIKKKGAVIFKSM